MDAPPQVSSFLTEFANSSIHVVPHLPLFPSSPLTPAYIVPHLTFKSSFIHQPTTLSPGDDVRCTVCNIDDDDDSPVPIDARVAFISKFLTPISDDHCERLTFEKLETVAGITFEHKKLPHLMFLRLSEIQSVIHHPRRERMERLGGVNMLYQLESMQYYYFQYLREQQEHPEFQNVQIVLNDTLFSPECDVYYASLAHGKKYILCCDCFFISYLYTGLYVQHF